MMRVMMAAALTMVSVALGGCATDVDDPVQQIPDPSPAVEAPAQALSGSLKQRINDPVYQALLDDTRAAKPGEVGARQVPNLGLINGKSSE